MPLLNKEMENKVLMFALLNRHEYGKCSSKHVFSKFMGEFKGMIDKTKIKEYMKEIEEICNRVNGMSDEEVKKFLQGVSEGNRRESRKKEKTLEELVNALKPLPNVEGRVITRFEPSPSGPLHLGHVFPLLLNYWYAKKYGGKMILRIADTNPKNILPEAYNMIVDDVEYLTGEFHEPVIQSSNMKRYYDVAEYLISQGFAYVCSCTSEEFRKYVINKKPCPHRNQTPEENMELWNKMVKGEIEEGNAVLRIKTVLDHFNPAIHDWVAFRIIKTPHPLLGKKYVVYPTMNFSVAVDDHFNNITHVIRGKDHETNTLKQQYIFDYMRWDMPTYLHIGRVNFDDLKLSTTETKNKIMQGYYDGWDDVRLPFIRSYRKRGFNAKAFSYWVLEMGLTKRDKKTTYDEFMKNFVKIHRKLIDMESDRLFFIKNPVRIHIVNLTENTTITLPNHPEREDTRVMMFIKSHPFVYLEKEDWDNIKIGEIIKLKYAFYLRKIDNDKGEIIKSSAVKEDKIKIIHYVPEESYVKCEVVMPNGKTIKGIVENNILQKPINSRLQFERFGFVKLDKIEEKLYIYVKTYYLHE